MKNRKKLRARRECKRVHHTYAVCTQRKMTKNDEKSICKPTLPTLTIFCPPSMPSAYVGRLSPTIRRGKKGASMGRRANQTKHYSMPSMPSHCVRLLCPTTYIHIYIHTYIPLCLRFAFFGFIVSSRLRRFPPKMIDARHPLLWVYE